MRFLTLIIASALMTSGSALLAKSGREVPVATETGAPVTCISLANIRESRVRSDNVIDFRTSGKKWYRNTLPNSCPSLGFEEAFSYSTSISQLCSVDIITVLNRTGGHLSRGASCGLGKFQPVEIAKR
jgi:hypothetical protein